MSVYSSPQECKEEGGPKKNHPCNVPCEQTERKNSLIIRRDVFLFALYMPIGLLKTLAKDEKSSLAFGIIQNDKHIKIIYIYITLLF